MASRLIIAATSHAAAVTLAANEFAIGNPNVFAAVYQSLIVGSVVRMLL